MATGLRELTATETQDLLTAGKITLIDVREDAEFAGEHIEGAILLPLSSFDPAKIPIEPGRRIVFQCGSGKRSAMAVAKAQAAGYDVDSHLAGGIMAWKSAGLPTTR